MAKKHFYIKHSHKHGTDFYVFETQRNHEDVPDLRYLCELFGIDYDFNYDDITEYIDWDSIEIIDLDEKI